MSFAVCITAAGLGSRLENVTKHINKAMVDIAGIPAITRIINQFPSDSRFIIALGYKGELLKEYIQFVHPSASITFVEVYPYEGPESGLGLSLLCCEPYLQEPFVFTSCDTLVKNDIPSPDENWLGYAVRKDLSSYRTLSCEKNTVIAINEKSTEHEFNQLAYIGLAGIKDYKSFWSAMKNNKNYAIPQGEVVGLRSLIPYNPKAKEFAWYDTGTLENLSAARQNFRSSVDAHILEKENEAIYFIDNQVIKFSTSKSFIQNRVKRASSIGEYIPNITKHSNHFYQYTKANGLIFSEVATLPKFLKLLKHCQNFWKIITLDLEQTVKFKKACLNFYKDKTIQRIDDYFLRYSLVDIPEVINDKPVPTLKALLDLIDWSSFSQGVPSRFHGDFHFENILYDLDTDKFTFLDWRQDFAGDLEIGDIYYDLAKLLHGLIVNHQIVAKDQFFIKKNANIIYFNIDRPYRLVQCEQLFSTWLIEQGYDLNKVYILCSLIFLNIAVLHHDPYSRLLFALGKSMLADQLLSDKNH